MEITIREVGGKFVACLPGSERIGPTVDTRAELEAQVRDWAKEHDLDPTEYLEETGTLTLEESDKESGTLDTESDMTAPDLPGKAVERDDVAEGYLLRRHGLWYKLFTVDGEELGKSRKIAEAIAFAE